MKARVLLASTVAFAVVMMIAASARVIYAIGVILGAAMYGREVEP